MIGGDEHRQAVLELLAEKAYQYSADGFLLVSGKRSHEYLDCKQALSLPESLMPLGYIFHQALDDKVAAIGGLTMGADPIAHMTAAASHGTSRPVRWFCVRKEQKSHGRKKMIEGFVKTGERVAIIDDVVTSGSSTIEAIRKAWEFGLDVVQVLVLVDREAGGLKNIQELVDPSVEVRALFTKSEVREQWESKRKN